MKKLFTIYLLLTCLFMACELPGVGIHTRYLTEDTTIDDVTYEKGVISIYENGQVHSGILAENATINGITYTGFIYFYPNGQVEIGILAYNQTINGITFAAGTIIRFDENGNITDYY
ncbi:MAG: hypothetical protein ACR2PY_02735 [Salinispira sp.]